MFLKKILTVNQTLLQLTEVFRGFIHLYSKLVFSVFIVATPEEKLMCSLGLRELPFILLKHLKCYLII